jgi:hypothetical protein
MQNWPGWSGTLTVATKTADYVVTDADQYLRADAKDGGITFTLPSAVGRGGKAYAFKKIDGSSNPVVIRTRLFQTIAGQSTLALDQPRKAVTLVSNGREWGVAATV